MTAACERLVHPAVTVPLERRRHMRFLAVVFCVPFLIAAAMVQLVGAHLGPAVTLAVIFGILGIGWLPALVLAGTGKRQLAEPLALVCGTVAIGLVTAAAGGLASPLAVAAIVLPVEVVWVARTNRAFLTGTVAGAVGLAAGLLTANALPGLGAEPSAAHWLLPLVYAVTIWPRVRHLLRPADSDSHRQTEPSLEDVMNAVVLRMNRAGDIAEASPQAPALLGVAPELLLGSGLFDRVHVADRVAYLNALADVREGAMSQEVSVRLRLPASEASGSVRYGQFTVEFLDEGVPDRKIAIVRDDSEAAALREELAAANERADSMEVAKSRFLASVSHELRTPLNAIIGFSDILGGNMAGALANDRQQEYVQLIREAGDHLLSVVNSILDVSKIESGSYEICPEPFRFRDAAELSLSLTRQQAEAKGVSLSADISDALGDVCCDRRAVQQILINLLSNAVKFTPSGGAVDVTAEHIDGRLELEVNDNGIGISDDDLQRIGQPFMQVQNDYTRQFEGTGLGLALVRGLVALQGGTMSIASAPGAGTCVRVALPLAEAAEKIPAEVATVPSASSADSHEKTNETLRKSA